MHFRKPLKSDCERLPGFLSPLPSAALVWPLLFFFISVFHGCCALCPVCSGEVCQAWLASVPGTLAMESSEDQEEDTKHIVEKLVVLHTFIMLTQGRATFSSRAH